LGSFRPPHLSNKLAILSCPATVDLDRKLAKLADMMGLHPVMIELCQAATLDASDGAERLEECGALAASARALSLIEASAGRDGIEAEDLLSRFAAVLLYCEQGILSSRALNFSGGPLNGELGLPVEVSDRTFTVSVANKLPGGCEQLRGLSFSSSGTRRKWRAFRHRGHGANFQPLVTAGDQALMMKVVRPSGDLFVLANGHLLDIDEAVFPLDMPTGIYLELVPWLIFLRAAFGEACWHNPNPRGCLIIDDPPLKPRYGFLCYEELLAAMSPHECASSIAFIPWNFRRSDPETSKLFRDNPGRLSLCVHGCDHTGGEFEAGSEGCLRRKAHSALSRMVDHQTSTGVGFDRVMVFPQGGFCKAALRALKAEGFLAAINTSVLAADWVPGDLTYRDMLDVAPACYEGCALFSRRYPGDLFAAAFDLFMGKPAFIVQHHGDFRNGYQSTIDFIAALNCQDASLVWQSPAHAIEETALSKRVGPHEQWVRFYTDALSYRNAGDDTMTCRFQRKLHRGADAVDVRRDGMALDFTIENGFLTTQLILAPGEAARIRICGEDEASLEDTRTGAFYRAGVASRRLLSDFRDNYIARNQWLLTKAERFKNFVRQRNNRRQYRYQ
jgi:hypothetical protein